MIQTYWTPCAKSWICSQTSLKSGYSNCFTWLSLASSLPYSRWQRHRISWDWWSFLKYQEKKSLHMLHSQSLSTLIFLYFADKKSSPLQLSKKYFKIFSTRRPITWGTLCIIMSLTNSTYCKKSKWMPKLFLTCFFSSITSAMKSIGQSLYGCKYRCPLEVSKWYISYLERAFPLTSIKLIFCVLAQN